MALTKAHQAQLDHELRKGVHFDLVAEPCVLTDKDEVKVIPCRKCGRVCICNRFASAAKTECTSCREGGAAPTKVREFDRSKETHILTDKEDTKEVPCRHCGRPCVVNQYAAPAKVACEECRKTESAPRRKVGIEKGPDGRYEEVVHVESPGDKQWSEWALGAPIEEHRLYLADERAEHDLCQAEALAAKQAARRTKLDQRERSEELSQVPERTKDKKVKERGEKLEAQIRELDELQVTQEDTHKIKSARASELARIAYIRGMLAHRYKLEKRNGRRHLTRGEFTVAIPDDYLSDQNYAIAQKPYQAEEVA